MACEDRNMYMQLAVNNNRTVVFDGDFWLTD